MLKLVALSMLGRWGAGAINRALFRYVPIPVGVKEFGYLVQRHYRPRMEALPLMTDQELGRLSMPTMLVAGEKDLFYDSKETAARLEATLPRFQAVLLSQAGHALLGTPTHILPFLAARECASPDGA